MRHVERIRQKARVVCVRWKSYMRGFLNNASYSSVARAFKCASRAAFTQVRLKPQCLPPQKKKPNSTRRARRKLQSIPLLKRPARRARLSVRSLSANTKSQRRAPQHTRRPSRQLWGANNQHAARARKPGRLSRTLDTLNMQAGGQCASGASVESGEGVRDGNDAGELGAFGRRCARISR